VFVVTIVFKLHIFLFVLSGCYMYLHLLVDLFFLKTVKNREKWR